MAKRISRTQFNQAMNKYKQAVNKYNSEVRKYNQKIKQGVNNYNRVVRKFNVDQQKRRQRLSQAIRAFNNAKYTTTRITTTLYYRESVEKLESSYNSLSTYNQIYPPYSEENSRLFEDYPIQETDNSIQLYNSLNGIDTGDYIEPDGLQKSYVIQKLEDISQDLANRWKGALFSLNPSNPDASRHFCTSVREVFTQVLDIKAPDNSVISSFPSCEIHQGKPTRRFKIKYILSLQFIDSKEFETFVDDDIEDLLSLFRTLNDGTHGSAGKYTIQQLLKLKKRVEDSISFIADL